MMQAITDIFDAMRLAFFIWIAAAFLLAAIILALRLDDEKARARNERLGRVRAEAAISFAADLERGTEARKFILLYRRGFMHEIQEQFPKFQPHMDARIACAMDDRS